MFCPLASLCVCLPPLAQSRILNSLFMAWKPKCLEPYRLKDESALKEKRKRWRDFLPIVGKFDKALPGNPTTKFPANSKHSEGGEEEAFINNMKSACLSLLLVSVCWALPFRQSGFMDFMMEDEPGSGDERLPATRKPPMQPPPFLPDGPDGPFCPFRCQCHLRVAQCSDLGLKNVPEKIPLDTTLLDLQNNKISEIRENDFKGLKSLQTLIMVNNKITIIHAKAFSSLINLERLYLSKNLLKEVPANIPKSLQELRIHENQINKIKKTSFSGMANVIVMELGSNPLSSSGVDNGAFADLKRVSYIRIADTNITAIPKGLPSSLFELHLDGNKITKVTADSLKGLKNLSNGHSPRCSPEKLRRRRAFSGTSFKLAISPLPLPFLLRYPAPISF
ncbi:unnamed protein product [Leuciscus chuanchicus]